jgi:hypothetical protein
MQDIGKDFLELGINKVSAMTNPAPSVFMMALESS